MKMIVLAGVVLLVSLAAAPAEAQFGLRGGVNLTRFVGGDVEEVEAKQGLNFGGSMRVLQRGRVSLVPEVYYAQKGAKVEQSASAIGPQQLDFSLSYVEIPVLARVDLLEPGRKLSPYVAGGPAFGWRVNCEVSMAGGQPAGISECGEQFGSAGTAFREADRGFVVTGGVDFRVLGFGALNLEARLVQGLARLAEGDGSGTDVRNQSFSLMLGYSFGM